MKDFKRSDDLRGPKIHYISRENENARRREQINRGVLRTTKEEKSWQHSQKS